MNKSNIVTVLDTETTGLPEWKLPSGSPEQPHLVQLGVIIADKFTGQEHETLDLIIRPDGWVIPQETIDVHGITQEMAMDLGVSEKLAVEMLIEMRGDLHRVAHNKTFDQRIIRIALKRYFGEDIQEKWAVKEDFSCSMMMAKPIMQMQKANAKPGSKAFKPPKLEEAVPYFTGKDLVGAHTAIADARGCKDIYVEMIKRSQGDKPAVVNEKPPVPVAGAVPVPDGELF